MSNKFYDIIKKAIEGSNQQSVAWMDAGTPSIQVGAQSNMMDEEEEENKNKKNKSSGFLGGVDTSGNIRL